MRPHRPAEYLKPCASGWITVPGGFLFGLMVGIGAFVAPCQAWGAFNPSETLPFPLLGAVLWGCLFSLPLLGLLGAWHRLAVKVNRLHTPVVSGIVMAMASPLLYVITALVADEAVKYEGIFYSRWTAAALLASFILQAFAGGWAYAMLTCAPFLRRRGVPQAHG
jgi:heme A synthase